MNELTDKQPVQMPHDEVKESEETASILEAPPHRAPEYAGYALAFLLGCVAVLAIRYMLSGRPVQLPPEGFVSLIFTIAVGAASLVLAIVAINYGRISERVMTERADRSIDIQMSLFQKSLDLQTQLFNKTMSTLESIGRSTGVTEQRLGDIHTLIQSPAALKQIAGRAVEQTTTELSISGKGGEQGSEFEAHLAERLTKNIVEELSARWNTVTSLAQNTATSSTPTTGSPSREATPATPAQSVKDFDERARAYQNRLQIQRLKKRMESQLAKAIGAITGAELRPNDDSNLPRTWDELIEYKDRTVAIDFRYASGLGIDDMSPFDRSIQGLFTNEEIACLVFMFLKPPVEPLKAHLEKRNKELGGRVRFLVAIEEAQLQSDLTALLDRISNDLPPVS